MEKHLNQVILISITFDIGLFSKNMTLYLYTLVLTCVKKRKLLPKIKKKKATATIKDNV